ncbi:MAG: NAD(P)H-hydrate dehydratase [Rikenellaceae bacterium]|jgi:NAD(P)H-hydrate epimerase|nr:NAD(P)H-hydrate dehydratase [Rikenellaceae bacterium]
MKILTGKQIREADRATLENQELHSTDLMERASERMAEYLMGRYDRSRTFLIGVGKGNNGGDGLAVARLLAENGYNCRVYTLFPPEACTEDYRINLRRLPASVGVEPFRPDAPPIPEPGAIVVDALLGVGVEGMAREPIATAIQRINSAGREVVSIDIPSGMATEFGNSDRPIVMADVTLALQFPSLSMLLPEAGECAGEVVPIDIGLDQRFIDEAPSPYFYVTADEVRHLVEKRPKFAFKNEYGHALLIAGSPGMWGAAVLATGGALRSGCGLVTVHLPLAAHPLIHTKHPAALVSADGGDRFTQLPRDLEKYTAIGIGSGLGQAPESLRAFEELLQSYRRPMVIDADGLNLLSANRELLKAVPPGSILTPHVGELRRLIGSWKDDSEKLQKTTELAAFLGGYVVIKGAYSVVCDPDGNYWFNSTGNPGMAKGGSGDVLTGLMTGLLAKGMNPRSVAILATYLHGTAGDQAARHWGQEAMNAEDIMQNLKCDE